MTNSANEVLYTNESREKLCIDIAELFGLCRTEVAQKMLQRYCAYCKINSVAQDSVVLSTLIASILFHGDDEECWELLELLYKILN